MKKSTEFAKFRLHTTVFHHECRLYAIFHEFLVVFFTDISRYLDLLSHDEIVWFLSVHGKWISILQEYNKGFKGSVLCRALTRTRKEPNTIRSS